MIILRVVKGENLQGMFMDELAVLGYFRTSQITNKKTGEPSSCVCLFFFVPFLHVQ